MGGTFLLAPFSGVSPLAKSGTAMPGLLRRKYRQAARATAVAGVVGRPVALEELSLGIEALRKARVGRAQTRKPRSALEP
jgi:hypothetical protein